jgi:hypothetical protein
VFAALPIGEFLSHYDRHLVFSLLDVVYTGVFLYGLYKLRTAERRELTVSTHSSQPGACDL